MVQWLGPPPPATPVCVGILVLSLPYCVTLGKLLNPFMPLFPHHQVKDKHHTAFRGWCSEAEKCQKSTRHSTQHIVGRE